MKRFLLIFLIISCFILQLSAQQLPQYTQYVFNNYLINPAISGIENYIDVKVGNRSQWVGLEGAPVTNFFSLHAPLGKKFSSGDANSFSGNGNNPMSRSYVNSYRAAEPHHGIGFHIVSDETGPTSRYDIDATYAYHLGLAESLNLSVGIAAGLSNLSLNRSELEVVDQTDAVLGNAVANKFKPDVGAGVWLYGPRLFLGLSAMQLLNAEFTSAGRINEGKEEGRPHFFGTAGFKLFLGDDIAAIPSVLVSKIGSLPSSLDLNLRTAFRDKFWLGGSYRKGDSFSAMAGFNISHLLNFSYAYDFTTSNLNSVSSGSHEIILGLLLNNKYKVTCPQRNW